MASADDTENTSKAQLKEPATFLNYRVLKELGRGSMGVVYLAETQRGTRVALKVLPPAFVLQKDAVERFTREAKAAASLDHPNVVKTFEARLENGVYYYTMRFIEGRSVRDLIDEGPMDLHRLCEIGSQVADALAYAHSQGVIHRDIKPANIVVTPQGRAMVMDFGIARIMSEATITATDDILGTPHYMSPEQARRERVDERTDIYSLGASLYEMATARKPFAGLELPEILTAVSYEEPPLPRSVKGDLSPALEAIIARAMAKRPGSRYASALDLKNDLKACGDGTQTTVRPIGSLRRLLHWRRRHPTGFSLALLLAFGLGVGGAAYHLIQEARDARQEALRGRNGLAPAPVEPAGETGASAPGGTGEAPRPPDSRAIDQALADANRHLEAGRYAAARDSVLPFAGSDPRAQAVLERALGEIQTLATSARVELSRAMGQGNAERVRSCLAELRELVPQDPLVAEADQWLAERR